MIIDAIDKYLTSRPRDERAKRCFHPSSLHRSEADLYRLYFEGDNRQTFPARIMRIFDNGHHVHERLQTYLEKIGILLEAEAPIENREYEIKGHTDGILNIGGIKGILEIKSMNARTFWDSDKPKKEHLQQVNIYMFCTGIHRACLLYECKDNQAMKEFYIKLDPVILDPLLDKIKRVQAAIKAGIPPEPAPPEPDPMEERVKTIRDIFNKVVEDKS